MRHLPRTNGPARKRDSYKSKQIGARYHRYVHKEENDNRMRGCCIAQDNGHGHKWPEKIHIFGCVTAAAPGDIQEVVEVEAASARFAIWLDFDARGNDLS